TLAVGDALAHPTWRGLWVEGHGLGALAVAALVLLPWAVVAGADHTGDVRQVVCAGSASMLTWVVAVPVLDEGLTAVTLAAAVAVVWWSLVTAVAPARWPVVPVVPLVASLLVLLPAPAALAVQAVSNLFSVAPPFSADASVRLDPVAPYAEEWLLPLGVAVGGLAAAAILRRGGWPRPTVARATAATVSALTVLLTAALFAVPLWLFVAVLGPLGLAIATPSAVLTLLVLAEIVAIAAALLRFRSAALVLPLALAGFLWTGGHLLDLRLDVTSLVTLGVLGLLAIAVPRIELELAATVAIAASSAVGITASPDLSVALAIQLTLAGALVTVTAIVHRDHRPLAWVGGLLLAAATWVRLYDMGVQAPEAYTLPTAVALVTVGGWRLLVDPDADTRTTLLPGLALATVPSLLWVLAEPVSIRAALLGLGCLVLVLYGVALRWSAPVVVGGLVGGAVVLRELGPYLAVWPQWVLIGIAGTMLLGVGITWEARLRDLRRTAVYLGRLR
ncbi:MAG TPA: hypothetical protein PLZ93_25625, partial [Nocardioides sp.]|nr:hypothetical protein [Nocardioides sp.]